jgi:hypothetical protein
VRVLVAVLTGLVEPILAVLLIVRIVQAGCELSTDDARRTTADYG